MDPLEGDNGALGGIFDTITGTVNSIENFGQTVNDVGTFNMSVAMIWAVIAFMFLSLLVRLGRPWSEAGAERWRATGRVIQTPAAPFRASKDQRIADLEEQVAELMAKLNELTGAEAPSRETANVD